MDVLSASERLLDDGNATEVPAEAPVALDPAVAEGSSPVAAPVSAPILNENAPISAPVSAPTIEESSPISAPVSFPSGPTFPTFPSTYSGNSTDMTPTSSSQDFNAFLLNPFHLIVIACVVGFVTLLLIGKCCKSWKLRREKQMLRLQSTRVDAVLGDMQMVGMDDYDGDDPELI